MKLWDWQVKDQETLEANDWTALVNAEPGAGKTVTGAAAIANSGAETTLIVAPAGTHQTAWAPTVKALTGLEARTISNGRKAERKALADFEWGEPGVYMVTPQLLTRADVTWWAGDMAIIDEVHQVAAPKGKGQRSLSGYDVNHDDPISRRFAHRLALSGTPIRNKFEYAWSIMRFLWPELNKRGQVAYANYYMWLKDRMTSEEIVTGSQIDPNTGQRKVKRATKWLREATPGRLFNEAPCVIQHFRRRECCEFHPNGFLSTEEPQVLTHVVDLAPAQRKAIKELEEFYMTFLDDRPLVTELSITQKQRIRQICLGVPTIEWFTEVDSEGEEVEKMTLEFDPDCVSPFYDEFLTILDKTEDEPVTVFLESQRFASVLVHKLNKAGISAFEYSGATRKTRDEDLAKFGSTYRVAVIVISAGGTGLDGLQRVSKTEVWFESSVDLTNNKQAQARVDRLGARGQVQRFVLHDPFGYAAGRMSSQLEKELELRKSTTRKVG